MRSHLFKEPCHDHPADPVIDELTAEISQQLANQDLAALAATLAPVADAELVSVFERLTLRQRAVIFRLLPKETAVAVFDALDPALQGDLLEGLHDTEVARLFAELDPDDRAWLLEEVPAVLATRLLRDLPGSERALTAALLGYPQGGVGRRMTPEYVSVRERATVAIALDRVRDRLADAETVYTIPVLDNARRIVGIVSLRELLAADPNAEISTLMQEAHTAKAADSAEEAARRCTDLSLLALPIVDSEQRLVGMLTIDDAVRILEFEESEDSARQGGTEPLRRPYLSTPVRMLVRSSSGMCDRGTFCACSPVSCARDRCSACCWARSASLSPA